MSRSDVKPQAAFPLLLLPLETRLLIYRFFSSDSWITLTKPRLKASAALSEDQQKPPQKQCCRTPTKQNNKRSAATLALLSVSRQLRKEAFQTLVQETLINIDVKIAYGVLRLEDFIPQSFSQHLQQLALRYPWCHSIEGLSLLPQLKVLVLYTSESLFFIHRDAIGISNITIGTSLTCEELQTVGRIFELKTPSADGPAAREYARGRRVPRILADRVEKGWTFDIELHFRLSSRKVSFALLATTSLREC